MKSTIQIFLLLCFAFDAKSQQIVGAEYFFDTEPGIGNGIPLSVAASDSVEFTTSIPYSNLDDGFHYLFIRFQNDSDNWSLNEQRVFFVQTVPVIDETIVTAEYFIDTEPGVGNGTPLNISAEADSVEQNFAITLDNFSPGFHYFFLRVKNATGRWSLADQRPFYVVTEDEIDTDIVAGEFFIDIEPGVGNGTPLNITNPADSIETDIAFTLPDLSLGAHILYIRLRNAEGNWTLIEPRLFNVCETYGAVSLFNSEENGNMVAFENQSLYADSLIWNFGDGITSNLNDPIHFYTDAGVYNVSLFTFNDCGTDTLTIPITIEGVESVSPNVVSNTSVSTLTVSGFGFTDGTTMKLTRTGFGDIIPVNNSVMNSFHLVSLINFTGQQIGLWNVEVEIPLEGTFVLENAVSVINSEAVNSNIVMTTTKPSLIRTGRRVPAIMHIENDNWSDVVAVPVFFRDISDVQQSIGSEAAPITQVPFFIETYQFLLDNNVTNTVMEFNTQEPALNSALSALVIPKIPAQSSYNLPFFFKRTVSGSHQRGSAMLNPQLNATSQLGTVEYENDVCMSSFVRIAAENVFAIDIDEVEWENCYNQWNDSLYTTLASMSADASMFDKPVSFGACITSLIIHMAVDGCVSNLPAVPSAVQLKALAAHVIANMMYLNDPEDVALTCSNLQGMILDPHTDLLAVDPERENEFCDLATECGGMCTSGGAAAGWCVLFGNGVDPNTKYGPGNNDDDIYVNPGDIAAYTIQFENDSAATAPVEIIHVTDSLEAGSFDLSSFEWGPVVLGDSIFIQPGSEEFHQVILKDLRPALPYYLLSHFDFDTTTAVVQWHFETLDTLNLQPLDLMLDGFLPPNLDGTEGAGYVNFFIRYNQELQTGDSIHNNAQILFDFNPVITTPYWNNAIDNTAPESAVDELPATIEASTFNVTWSGTDTPAGISSYTIYVSENEGPFLLWIISTNESSAMFTGQIGSTYKFFSVAKDHAGNMEEAPENPQDNYDAITQLVTSITELNSIGQLLLYPNPAEHSLTIELNLNQSADVKIELLNALGEKISSDETARQFSAGTHRDILTVDKLSSGVYLLKVEANNEIMSRYFVKQ